MVRSCASEGGHDGIRENSIPGRIDKDSVALVTCLQRILLSKITEILVLPGSVIKSNKYLTEQYGIAHRHMSTPRVIIPKIQHLNLHKREEPK